MFEVGDSVGPGRKAMVERKKGGRTKEKWEFTGGGGWVNEDGG